MTIAETIEELESIVRSKFEAHEAKYPDGDYDNEDSNEWYDWLNALDIYSVNQGEPLIDFHFEGELKPFLAISDPYQESCTERAYLIVPIESVVKLLATQTTS